MTDESRRWPSEDVVGVILAGGRNTRMGGHDKAFLRINGETAFERILGVLRECFSRVLVVSNHPEKYAAFPIEVIRDELPSVGPLAGLHAAMGRVDTSHAFVTACDMPFLRVEPIRYLVSRLRGQEALVPRWNGDIEPLHALYAASLRPRIAAAVRGGVHALRDFLPLIDVAYLPEADLLRVEGAEESFRNVNTPEEAARFALQVGT